MLEIAAVDLGSSRVKTVIGRVFNGQIEIIGYGQASSESGIRRGVIISLSNTARAIRKSLEEAEIIAGRSISNVVVSTSGAGTFSYGQRTSAFSKISGINTIGVVAIKDGEVNDEEIERVIRSASSINLPSDRDEIIHVIPKFFSVDENVGIKDPLGMSGKRLTVDTHIVAINRGVIDNIWKALKSAREDLNLVGIVFKPIASAESVLTEEDMELGVITIDIGSGTTGITVHSPGGYLQHSEVINIGGEFITKDIAKVLKITSHRAEELKINYGVASPELANPDVEIPVKSSRIRQSTLAEIIRARLEEIITLSLRDIGEPLDSIGMGIVLTGGTANLKGIESVVEELTSMSASVRYPQGFDGVGNDIGQPEFSTAVGTLEYFFNHIGTYIPDNSSEPKVKWSEKVKSVFKEITSFFENFF